ncbi:hypothetical protein SASPL_105625 [Salvia splendens]|uniref:Myb/SANT-like domain-containing protein n=1 Tax=Salvia splendens TaxID=180675 RepID=A0A8X9AAX3_SALSN|nr:hypothetical protein SASPL_105625 [Salvia splendens]
MSENIPAQSSFLYDSRWTQEIDSVVLGTLVRLKRASGCDGTLFPSHFLVETKIAIETKFGNAFEWFDLVDRLHFLEKRYKTFNEIQRLEGTSWDASTNTVIVRAPNWDEALERNPLLGAYHEHGDPAYRQLYELFALNVVKEEHEPTVIVLSESCQPGGQVAAGPWVMAPPRDTGEVNSDHPFSLARRKLMFDDGSNVDRESTNKKKGPRILPREFPPNSPNYALSCASNSPVPKWRMPRKPKI